MRLRGLFQRFNDLSIRTKLLIAFIATAVVPLALLAVVSDRTSRASLTDAANQALLSSASQTAADIDLFVSAQLENVNNESQLVVFSQFLSAHNSGGMAADVQAESEALLFALTAVHRDDDNIGQDHLLGYSLLDGSGTILLDTHFPAGFSGPYIDQNWADRSYVRAAMNSEGPISSNLEFSPESGIPGIYFAAKIIDSSGDLLGTMLIHYRALVFQEIVEDRNDTAGEGSFGVLFDENLTHMAHGLLPSINFTIIEPLPQAELDRLIEQRELPNWTADRLVIDLPVLAENLKMARENPFFEATDEATDDLVNQVAVAPVERFNWQIAFFQPRVTFLAPAGQQTNLIVGITGVILVLTIVSALIATRFIAAPIGELTTVASEVASGNFNVTAQVRASDEIGVLATAFNDMTGQIRQSVSDLEDRVATRTRLLTASAEVSRAASSILNPEQLIAQVVQLITDEFGYYYSAIFLTDASGGWAELRDATGEAGAELLARNHRLEIGGQSMVGSAIERREARIALDVGDEPVRFNNPLLLATRSEMALPLIVGERVLGALDVQSTEPAAFGNREIETLQNMVSQVAIALENARLFQESQRSLDEISRLNNALVDEGWRDLDPGQVQALSYRNHEISVAEKPPLPDMEHAVRSRQAVQRTFDDHTSLTVPLVLRQQVIGVLNLKSRNASWDAGDFQLIEQIGAQTALALENARLLDESRQNAQREQVLGEMTGHFHETLDLQSILQTAAREMRELLNLEEVEIELLPPEPESSQNGEHDLFDLLSGTGDQS
jgi:GAF domain-containing protein/HAMP domain-containing protein